MRQRQKNNSMASRMHNRMPTQTLNHSQLPQYQTHQYRSNVSPSYQQYNSLPMQTYIVPDSLQRLQMYLDKQWERNKHRQQQLMKPYIKKGRKRVMTEIDSDQEEENRLSQKMSSVMNSIKQLKEDMTDMRKKKQDQSRNRMDQKFDKVLNELVKKRQEDQQIYRQQQNNIPPPPQQPIYYPFPFPSPYQQPRPRQYDQTRLRDYDQSRYRESNKDSYYQRTRYRDDRFKKTGRSSTKLPKTNNKLRRLKKYIRAVVFISFLKKEAAKLAQTRRQKMRTFFLQKFDKQMVNLKNWLLDGQAFALPVILQKQNLKLQFWQQSRSDFALEKQGLLLKIVQLGLQKTKKECAVTKINLFVQLLHNICGRGNFPMSRFWSAVEMDNICISQNYGCVRADVSLQKFMIGLVVFVKVLVFNMLLQPHKFDPLNFPKNKPSLTKIMFLVASVYYKLAKIILNQYLQSGRGKQYRLGNWLNVNQKFVVECHQPLKFGCEYPQQGEWVSGLLGGELQSLQMRQEWDQLLQRMREIIQTLHRQMMQRRKQVITNDKYKLHN